MLLKIACFPNAAILLMGLFPAAPSVRALVCPEEPSASSPLYPHESKCYLYYECLGDQPFLLSCTYPLLYDATEHKCQVLADCGGRDLWGKSGEEDIFSCPEPNGVFPNDKYCWKYWSCGSGVAYEADCPSNYLFGIEHKYCDFPENVDCGDRQPRPSGSSTTPSAGLTTTRGEVASEGASSSTTGGPKTTRPDDGTFHCPAEEGLFPNPDDCESYYTCANFVAWLANCPPGQQFDPDQQSCDFAFNVNCKETSSGLIYVTQPPTTPKPTEDPSFNCPEPTGNFAYPGDCHYYYKCEGGLATLFWCGDGMFFNEQGGYCDVGDCAVSSKKRRNVPKLISVSNKKEKSVSLGDSLSRRKPSISGEKSTLK